MRSSWVSPSSLSSVQDVRLDPVGGIRARVEGPFGDADRLQGGGFELQHPAGERRAHLEHPWRAEQQLAQDRPEGSGG